MAVKKVNQRPGSVVVGRHARRLNCMESLGREDDWRLDQAMESGLMRRPARLPRQVDLREDWWDIRDQEDTGACVGFAAADGVLRWHYVKAGLIDETTKVSPRFIWMANKEIDEIMEYPTSFIDGAGTQTKSAMKIARRYGAVTEDVLPMNGPLFTGSPQSFYMLASRLRIASYINLGMDLQEWRFWLAHRGPILARILVDQHFRDAGPGSHVLEAFRRFSVSGAHAVSLVGYLPGRFIVRNSWGTDWGDRGFVEVKHAYVKKAFTEAYGVNLCYEEIGG